MKTLSEIDRNVLLEECPYLSLIEEQGMSWDEVGRLLDLHLQGAGPRASANRDTYSFGLQLKPKTYWESVKKEIFTLLCTKDKKYSEIRKRLEIGTGITTIYVLSTISVWLSNLLSAQFNLIAPLVATVLYAVTQIGVSAWCELEKKRIILTMRSTEHLPAGTPSAWSLRSRHSARQRSSAGDRGRSTK